MTDGDAISMNDLFDESSMTREGIHGLLRVLDRSRNRVANAFDLGKDDVPTGIRKWLRNEVDGLLKERNCSLEEITWDLKWLHQDFIQRSYTSPVEEIIHSFGAVVNSDSPITQSALARRYGVDRATAKKWLEGNQQIGLGSFCMVSAVEDLKYKRGHVYAMKAYVLALERAIACFQRTSVCQVTAETVWYLIRQLRSTRWWYALQTVDRPRLQQLALEFSEEFELHFNCKAELRTFEKQLAVMAAFWLEWSLIEMVLPYGWL